MNNSIYESKPIHSLIVAFSIPAILSLLVEVLTSVVDTAFAGHLGGTSEAALTALGLLTPVLSLFTAIQALFAVSTSILLARHFQNKTLRDQYFLTGLICTVLVSAGVSVLALLGMAPLLTSLGAQGEVYVLAREYLTIQLVSNVFSALGYTLTSCIRALGDPNTEMRITTGAVVVNIAGNALFAFGFSGQRDVLYTVLGPLDSKTRIYAIRSRHSWDPYPANSFGIIPPGDCSDDDPGAGRFYRSVCKPKSASSRNSNLCGCVECGTEAVYTLIDAGGRYYPGGTDHHCLF